MKALTKQRLLKIADAIEAAPADRFDMGTWLRRKVIEPWGRTIDFTESPANASKLTTSCWTAGCIAGWTVGVFPRAGKPDLLRWYSIEEHATRILDLTLAEADALFRTGMQMNNKAAAKRIRKAVEQDSIEKVGPRGGRWKPWM